MEQHLGVQPWRKVLEDMILVWFSSDFHQILLLEIICKLENICSSQGGLWSLHPVVPRKNDFSVQGFPVVSAHTNSFVSPL